jgi:hypothetical protein
VKIRVLVRWALSAVLLYFVWRHAHWSVALALTLITFDIEVANHTIGLMIDLIGKVVNSMKEDTFRKAVEKLRFNKSVIH